VHPAAVLIFIPMPAGLTDRDCVVIDADDSVRTMRSPPDVGLECEAALTLMRYGERLRDDRHRTVCEGLAKELFARAVRQWLPQIATAEAQALPDTDVSGEGARGA
jgi:hypothetical protein